MNTIFSNAHQWNDETQTMELKPTDNHSPPPLSKEQISENDILTRQLKDRIQELELAFAQSQQELSQKQQSWENEKHDHFIQQKTSEALQQLPLYQSIDNILPFAVQHLKNQPAIDWHTNDLALILYQWLETLGAVQQSMPIESAKSPKNAFSYSPKSNTTPLNSLSGKL